MYLTRMELNTKNMDTIRLLGSQEKIHGLVESGFLGERKRISGRQAVSVDIKPGQAGS